MLTSFRIQATGYKLQAAGLQATGRRQKTEDRKQKSEDRRQKIIGYQEIRKLGDWDLVIGRSGFEIN